MGSRKAAGAKNEGGALAAEQARLALALRVHLLFVDAPWQRSVSRARQRGKGPVAADVAGQLRHMVEYVDVDLDDAAVKRVAIAIVALVAPDAERVPAARRAQAMGFAQLIIVVGWGAALEQTMRLHAPAHAYEQLAFLVSAASGEHVEAVVKLEGTLDLLRDEVHAVQATTEKPFSSPIASAALDVLTRHVAAVCGSEEAARLEIARWLLWLGAEPKPKTDSVHGVAERLRKRLRSWRPPRQRTLDPS